MNQDERIAHLKEELRRLNDGVDPPSFGLDRLPKDMAEQLLERIVAFETGQAADKLKPLSGDGKVWHVAIPTRKESKK